MASKDDDGKPAQITDPESAAKFVTLQESINRPIDENLHPAYVRWGKPSCRALPWRRDTPIAGFENQAHPALQSSSFAGKDEMTEGGDVTSKATRDYQIRLNLAKQIHDQEVRDAGAKNESGEYLLNELGTGQSEPPTASSVSPIGTRRVRNRRHRRGAPRQRKAQQVQRPRDSEPPDRSSESLPPETIRPNRADERHQLHSRPGRKRHPVLVQ